jgi:hypothetical protein
MTTQPANYTLVIPQRASLREKIRVPYDGSGVEVYAEVWDSEKRRKKFLSLDVEWVNRHEEYDPQDETKIRSTIILSASWEETKTITKNGYWDLLWVWPDGLRDYILEGQAIVNRNATEEAT